MHVFYVFIRVKKHAFMFFICKVMFLTSMISAVTVGVVGVRSPPKIQVGGDRHPQKNLKENIRRTSQ